MPQSKASFSISELAQEFALTTRAIRFYEEEGLITPTRQGRNRVYGARERTRLKLIPRRKRLGRALTDSREILDLDETDIDESPQVRKFIEVLERLRER